MSSAAHEGAERQPHASAAGGTGGGGGAVGPVLENSHYKLEFDATGRLSAVTNKLEATTMQASVGVRFYTPTKLRSSADPTDGSSGNHPNAGVADTVGGWRIKTDYDATQSTQKPEHRPKPKPPPGAEDGTYDFHSIDNIVRGFPGDTAAAKFTVNRGTLFDDVVLEVDAASGIELVVRLHHDPSAGDRNAPPSHFEMQVKIGAVSIDDK